MVGEAGEDGIEANDLIGVEAESVAEGGWMVTAAGMSLLGDGSSDSVIVQIHLRQ